MKVLVVGDSGVGKQKIIEGLRKSDPKLRFVDSIRGSHIARTNFVIIICYDITIMDTFDNTVNWLREVERFCKRQKKILVGNKLDLSDDRQVSTKMAKEFADSLNLMFCEVSAKDGTNMEKILTQPERQDGQTKIIISDKPKVKSKCFI